MRAKVDGILTSWKKYAAGLVVLSALMGYYYVDSGSESAGSMAAGANVLLVALLVAVFARAIWYRTHGGRPASIDARPAPAPPPVTGDHWRR